MAAELLPPGELEALRALYDQTDGETWRRRDRWITESSPCTWYGVTCAGNNVVGLDLPANTLRGTLPSELGLLSRIKRLDLAGNQLHGSLPVEIGHLRDLTFLDLSDNHLGGHVPTRFRLLRRLRRLDLHGNRLNGPLPGALGDLTALERLDLSGNDLSGTVPEEVGRLRNLIELDLNDNDLRGVLPRSLVRLEALESFCFAGTELLEPPEPEFQHWLQGLTHVESPGVLYAEVVSSVSGPALAALAGIGTLGASLAAALLVALPLLGPIAGAVAAATGTAGAALVGKGVYDLTQRRPRSLPGPISAAGRSTSDEELRRELRQELRRIVRALPEETPADVVERVEGLERTIVALLPHIRRLRGGHPDAYTLRRTVRDYLPAALDAYLALPADYATEQLIQDEKTAHAHLLRQLELLQRALDDIAAGLPGHDAQRLLIHGRFLESKFDEGEDIK